MPRRPTAGSTPPTTAGSISGTTATTAKPVGTARPSAGCGTSTVGALDAEKQVLTVAGEERFFLLTTPPAHDGKTPVPWCSTFTGSMEGAEVHAGMCQYFGKVAEEEGFVVVFPHGTASP